MLLRPRVLFLARYWEERFLVGLAEYAREAGWVLHTALRRMHSEIPPPWRGDGVIANTLGDPALLEYIGSLGLPTVVTDTHGETLGAPMVYNQNESIGAAGAEHLLSLGFEHFAFILPPGQTGSPRASGFETTVATAGKSSRLISIRNLEKELPHLPRPMAMMAPNDVYALDAMHVIEAAGFQVPRDFALVGADDDEITCTLCPVPLTSVNLDYEGRGYHCARILDDLMHGRSPASMHIIRPIRGVTVRKSTDTIAIPHPAAAEALRFIRENYRTPISLTDIADHLGISIRGIQEPFRLHVGRPLAAEISRLRVQAALELLKQPKLKLETIASECGYSGRVHLARAILREKGVSPQTIRRQLRDRA